MISAIVVKTLKEIGLKATPGYGKGKYPVCFYNLLDSTVGRVTRQQVEIRILDKDYDQLEKFKKAIVEKFHMHSNYPSKIFDTIVYRTIASEGGIFWNENEYYDCNIYVTFSYHTR